MILNSSPTLSFKFYIQKIVSKKLLKWLRLTLFTSCSDKRVVFRRTTSRHILGFNLNAYLLIHHFYSYQHVICQNAVSMRHFVFSAFISVKLIILNCPFEINLAIGLVETLIELFTENWILIDDCKWSEIGTEFFYIHISWNSWKLM